MFPQRLIAVLIIFGQMITPDVAFPSVASHSPALMAVEEFSRQALTLRIASIIRGSERNDAAVHVSQSVPVHAQQEEFDFDLSGPTPNRIWNYFIWVKRTTGIPSHLKVTSLASGGTVSDLLFATDAKELVLVDINPWDGEALRGGLLASMTMARLSGFQMANVVEHIGVRNSFLYDLEQLGVQESELTFRQEGRGINVCEFLWGYPGELPVKRTVYFYVNVDVNFLSRIKRRPELSSTHDWKSIAEPYIPPHIVGSDILLQKGSNQLPLSYESYLPGYLAVLAPNAWIITDDVAALGVNHPKIVPFTSGPFVTEAIHTRDHRLSVLHHLASQPYTIQGRHNPPLNQQWDGYATDLQVRRLTDRQISPVLKNWQDWTFRLIQRTADPILLWDSLDIFISWLIDAEMHFDHFVPLDSSRVMSFTVPSSPKLAPKEFPALGDFIREQLQKHPTFHQLFGDIAPHIMSIIDEQEPLQRFRAIESALNQLVGESPRAKLLADFTEGLAIVRHLRANGLHTLDEDALIDNELLMRAAQRFIEGVLALTPEEWNAEIAQMPGQSKRAIYFGDMMLWGVAQLIDPRVHDTAIYMDAHGNKRRLYEGNPEIRSASAVIETTLRQILPQHERLGWLLAQALKPDEEWQRRGFRVPGLDADNNPGDFAYRLRIFSASPKRIARDAVFNFALVDAPEQQIAIRNDYITKYGASIWDIFSRHASILVAHVGVQRHETSSPVVYSIPNRMRNVPSEDAYFAFQLPGGIQVAAVFDGMGGHAHGEVASQAAAAFVETKMRKMSFKGDVAKVIKRVTKILLQADQMLKEHKEWADGRGTTVAIALTRPSLENADQVEILSFVVGDSRVYASTPEGNFHVLSLDDSPGKYLDGLAPIQAATGPGTPQHFLSHVTSLEEVRSHPLGPFYNSRHMIDNALTPGGGEWEGRSPSPVPQISRIILPVGSRLLVATDGLTDTVEDPRLGKVFFAAPKGFGARAVIEVADGDTQVGTFRSHDDDRTAAEIITAPAPPSTSRWGNLSRMVIVWLRRFQGSATKNTSLFSTSA